MRSKHRVCCATQREYKLRQPSTQKVEKRLNTSWMPSAADLAQIERTRLIPLVMVERIEAVSIDPETLWIENDPRHRAMRGAAERQLVQQQRTMAAQVQVGQAYLRASQASGTTSSNTATSINGLTGAGDGWAYSVDDGPGHGSCAPEDHPLASVDGSKEQVSLPTNMAGEEPESAAEGEDESMQDMVAKEEDFIALQVARGIRVLLDSDKNFQERPSNDTDAVKVSSPLSSPISVDEEGDRRQDSLTISGEPAGDTKVDKNRQVREPATQESGSPVSATSGGPGGKMKQGSQNRLARSLRVGGTPWFKERGRLWNSRTEAYGVRGARYKRPGVDDENEE